MKRTIEFSASFIAQSGSSDLVNYSRRRLSDMFVIHKYIKIQNNP